MNKTLFVAGKPAQNGEVTLLVVQALKEAQRTNCVQNGLVWTSEREKDHYWIFVKLNFPDSTLKINLSPL